MKILLISTIFIISLTFGGCAPLSMYQNTPKKIENCNFSTEKGQEFVFAEQGQSSHKYGYGWKATLNGLGKNLDYYKYVNKHGKLRNRTVYDKYRISKYHVAIIENCEIIYANKKNYYRDIESSLDGIYFVKTLNESKKLIGKTIWTKKAWVSSKSKFLFTPNRNIKYPITNIQELTVIGIDKVSYGHTYGTKPFSLIVKTQEGNTALLPYSSLYFYKINPIEPDWNNRMINLIKEEKIVIGMTRLQARTSWGEPKKINESIGSYGIHEQWVYDDGNYIYFENNKLTNIQSSR